MREKNRHFDNIFVNKYKRQRWKVMMKEEETILRNYLRRHESPKKYGKNRRYRKKDGTIEN